MPAPRPNLPIRSHVKLRRRLDGLKSGNEQRQRTAENTLRQLELAFARSIKNAKAVFIADCAASYRSHRERDFHTELLAHRMAVKQLLSQQATRVIPRFAADTQRSIAAGLKSARPIEAKRDNSAFSRLIQQWLDQRRDMATTIAQTSLNDVLRAVEGGIEDGAGTDEIARAIESTAKLGRYRSLVVARTETHAAALYAQAESAREAEQAYEITLVKEWLSTLDDRTRDTHADANGQVVPLNENFVVGGVEMDRPGDPSAPPSETVNCRCTCVFREAEKGE